MSAPDTEALPEWKEMNAGEEASGKRVDQWLAVQLGPNISRSRVKSLIEHGDVRLNGSRTEAKRRLAAGDSVAWRLGEPIAAEPQPQNIVLNVLYEDAHLIVIDKPAGLVVHPGAGNPDGTLVNALLHHCGNSLSGIGGVKRPGIVHRLDKDTSGVMVAAKTDAAHRHLSELFADHGRSGDLERSYLALVWGVPDRQRGTIDAPLGRAAGDRTRRAVVPAGRADARHAVTDYQVLQRFGPETDGGAAAALVECRLKTGRTHQIRVHLAHIGHPLIGDPVYGQGFRTKVNRLPEPAKTTVFSFGRQALHAATLGFVHPQTGDYLRFDAPMPADLQDLVNALEIL